MLASPSRLCRPCRLAGAVHPAATAGFSIPQGEISRETDCLLEGNGFELSVPREMGSSFETSSELGPIRPVGAAIIRAVVGLGKPIERLRRLEELPLTAGNAPTPSAAARHRGTESSNPFLSGGGSVANSI
jgi:hypothetical protein